MSRHPRTPRRSNRPEGLSDGVVRLRSPTDADAGWIADSVSDPEVPRWTRIPSPYTKDDAFAWVALSESMAREGSAHNLVITAVPDGERLGTVGLQIHDEEPAHGELGYWVAAPVRGRGVAPRAVRLLAGWALEELGLALVEIHVLPANTPSHAVARKAGFSLAGRRLLPFRGRVEDFDVYALDGTGAVVADRPGLVLSSTPAKASDEDTKPLPAMRRLERTNPKFSRHLGDR